LISRAAKLIKLKTLPKRRTLALVLPAHKPRRVGLSSPLDFGLFFGFIPYARRHQQRYPGYQLGLHFKKTWPTLPGPRGNRTSRALRRQGE